MLTKAFKLRCIATVGLCLLFSPTFAQPARMDGTTLRIGTYGGPWQQAVHENVGKKLEALGVKVEYVVGNPAGNAVKVAEAKGKNVPIDVMEMGPAERYSMSRDDLLEDLPASKILNLFKISLDVSDKKTIKHQIDRKTVAHQIVQNGILFRSDRFKQEKIAIPQSFEDLTNPKLAGRISFPDVTNPQYWPAVSALSNVAGGNETNPLKGMEKAVGMKPRYFYAAATELMKELTEGDVIAAPSHVGMAIRMYNSGQAVDFVHPVIGNKRGEVEYNYLGIVKGTKNIEAAAAFINIFLDADAQAGFAKPMGVVPVNREARQRLLKDPVMSRFMLLSDRELLNTYSMDWSKVNTDQWRATWKQVNTR